MAAVRDGRATGCKPATEAIREFTLEPAAEGSFALGARVGER